MAGLSWVHWLGLLLAVTSSGAQIFPFSNLKHIFEQKGKAGQGAARAPPPATTPSPLGSPGFAPTLEPSTTTLEPTTTVGPVSGLAPYYGPYSLFDEDDGYREFQRPDLVVTERARPAPKASKPTAAVKPKHQAAAAHPKYSPSATKQTPPSRLAASKPTAAAAAGQQAKHKKRLVESHLHAVPPAGRPSHYVPIKIAYEPTTPSGLPAGAVGDVHVLPAASAGPAGPGDGRPLLPPPLYLTPPRLPNPVPVDASPSSSAPHAVLEAIDAAASSHPTSASSPSAAAAAAAAPIAMPPVPAVYLRPPGPPGPSGPPEPVLFKHSGVKLQLADVADAALSHSTNPGILKTARPQARPANSTPATPANHKLTSAPHNALQAGTVPGPSKLGAEYTNHYGDKYTKHGPKGAPGNHKPDPTDKPLALSAAESSAAAAIALGPAQRTPANHRPGLRPQPAHQHQQQQQQAPRAPKFKNHKQGPVAAPSAPRPVKYHNHRPGSLDGEESSASLRYRKRPLGPIEQEVASSGIQHTGKYPSSGDGDRVEFQMHGLQGPESYKFGYDTGSGHNRQFRYEERDPHGNVKGHYGYVDEHGKLQIVNYKADPHHGYSADVSKLHT